MNIVINAILYHDKPRGVGTYLNNLLKELSIIDDENNYFIYYGSWMENYDFLKIKKNNFYFIKVSILRNKIIRNLYQLLIFPFAILKYKPDIVHIPDTSPVLIKTCKTISTIHDIAEFIYPEKYSKLQAFARRLIVKLQVKFSNKIITVSEFSRNMIIKKLNVDKNKIITIYNGVNLNRFYHVERFNIGKKFNIKRDEYLLFVGEIERTKNISTIIEALNILRSKNNFKLVISGKKGNDYNFIMSKIDNYKLNDRVIITGYVSETDLLELYSNCFAFIFPSLFEGFGIPIIEAMACGAPVISSNSSSLFEIGGDAVLFFDPNNPNELVEKINTLLFNNNVRNNLIKNGYKKIKHFNWQKSAEETLTVYKNI
ncbi:glycosyltransferase family 1 protein [Thermoanaerobacterium thermosaccharolyticum]|uniref:glycosyltransferase family 4 protein n=1 Tax=Thermoanaerobacterium thermosaccharolyticum TaxID=1517 RepID=UPI003DA8061E